MKVALVILHADPSRGGAERYTIDLAAALARRGVDVSLLATSFAQVPDGVTQVQLAAPGLTRTARYESMLNALDAHVFDVAYDIVHAMLPVRGCDVYHPHAGLALAAVETMSPAKRLLNPRRVRFATVERDRLTKPRPPVVLCLSEYVKRDVRRLYPNLPDEKLATLFNAVDLDRFDPSRPFAVEAGREDLVFDAKRTIALMIAQDFLRKGLRETLEALAQIEPSQRPALVVVGKGKIGAYQRLARAMRLDRGRFDRDVFFQGPTAAPDRYYRKADFFVLLTKHDPCSLVVLEALAMGLPVISTVFNGATEVMTDGVHGLILKDPADVDALARAMTTLCDDARRHEMADACKTLRPTLAYEHHVDELMAIYRLALARKGIGDRE